MVMMIRIHLYVPIVLKCGDDDNANGCGDDDDDSERD